MHSIDTQIQIEQERNEGGLSRWERIKIFLNRDTHPPIWQMSIGFISLVILVNYFKNISEQTEEAEQEKAKHTSSFSGIIKDEEGKKYIERRFLVLEPVIQEKNKATDNTKIEEVVFKIVDEVILTVPLDSYENDLNDEFSVAPQNIIESYTKNLENNDSQSYVFLRLDEDYNYVVCNDVMNYLDFEGEHYSGAIMNQGDFNKMNSLEQKKCFGLKVQPHYNNREKAFFVRGPLFFSNEQTGGGLITGIVLDLACKKFKIDHQALINKFNLENIKNAGTYEGPYCKLYIQTIVPLAVINNSNTNSLQLNEKKSLLPMTFLKAEGQNVIIDQQKEVHCKIRYDEQRQPYVIVKELLKDIKDRHQDLESVNLLFYAINYSAQKCQNYAPTKRNPNDKIYLGHKKYNYGYIVDAAEYSGNSLSTRTMNTFFTYPNKTGKKIILAAELPAYYSQKEKKDLYRAGDLLDVLYSSQHLPLNLQVTGNQGKKSPFDLVEVDDQWVVGFHLVQSKE